MNSTWRKVTKAEPCLICGKADWCKVSADGAVALCGRIEQGSFGKAKGNGGFMHRLIEKPRPNYSGNGHPSRSRPAADKSAKAFPNAQAAIEAAGRTIGGSFVNGWPYHNREGHEVLRVIRYVLADGEKQYRPIHQCKDGWRIGDPSGLLPLYRLPEIVASTETVYVVEGEKAADAASKLELAATTSAHGSGAADKTDWLPLAGRDVVILPDADEPGRKYAQSVARLLVKLEEPARVKIVELPDLPDKGDIVEFIDARQGQSRDRICAEVETLASKAPILSPDEFIGGPVLLCMEDVEAKEISWLWPGRVPLGRISLLVGRPGEGKSFATTDMAARVTTGTPWPDGSDCPKGSVILVSAEDDPGDTIKPRLDAHHADCRKVHLLSAVKWFDEQAKPQERMFTLADLPALEAALKRNRDCKLIVVDPIGSFLGGSTDAHRDNEVRGILAPVAKLAEKYGPAVLVVAHRRKSAGFNADETALGSRAFTGIARAVWHLSRDNENKNRRLLLPGKNNLAPEGDGLAFTICGNPPSIVWERDPVTMSADEALSIENNNGGEAKGPGRPSDERMEAEEWLAAELADLQEHVVKDIQRDAKAAGISWRTVQRASTSLKVIRQRNAFGGHFIWRLPKPGNLSPPVARNAVKLHDANRATIQENDNSGTNGTIAESGGECGFEGVLSVPEPQPCQNLSLGTHGDGRERGEL
jgi:hypothetical protein